MAHSRLVYVCQHHYSKRPIYARQINALLGAMLSYVGPYLQHCWCCHGNIPKCSCIWLHLLTKHALLPFCHHLRETMCACRKPWMHHRTRSKSSSLVPAAMQATWYKVASGLFVDMHIIYTHACRRELVDTYMLY